MTGKLLSIYSDDEVQVMEKPLFYIVKGNSIEYTCDKNKQDLEETIEEVKKEIKQPNNTEDLLRHIDRHILLGVPEVGKQQPEFQTFRYFEGGCYEELNYKEN